jgi:hypothetical protein
MALAEQSGANDGAARGYDNRSRSRKTMVDNNVGSAMSYQSNGDVGAADDTRAVRDGYLWRGLRDCEDGGGAAIEAMKGERCRYAGHPRWPMRFASTLLTLHNALV